MENEKISNEIDSKDSKNGDYLSLLGSRSHQFAIAASEWALANGSPEPGWEMAHTPLPAGMGDTWVWLPHDLHQIHGLLQSIDLGHTHYWVGATYRFLTHGPFVKDWFELFEIYEKTHLDGAMKGAEVLHLEKLPDGRSKNAVENCVSHYLWKVIYPNGQTHYHSGLRQLCIDYDLKQSKLCLVAQGLRTHHKHFVVEKIGPSPLPPE